MGALPYLSVHVLSTDSATLSHGSIAFMVKGRTQAWKAHQCRTLTREDGNAGMDRANSGGLPDQIASFSYRPSNTVR
jgi:hypothetical protein